MEQSVASYNQGRKSAEKFIALIDEYKDFDTMTATMLNEFVEKILVHERDQKGRQDTGQEIDIYFNFVGRYIPPNFMESEATSEEQAELQKKEAIREMRHQQYLRRKASGTQERYEDKIKAAKKAEMDAKKDAIRAEARAKGVYAYVGDLPAQEPQKVASSRVAN